MRWGALGNSLNRGNSKYGEEEEYFLTSSDDHEIDTGSDQQQGLAEAIVSKNKRLKSNLGLLMIVAGIGILIFFFASESDSKCHQHDFSCHIRMSEKRYNAMLTSQSKNLQEARDTYASRNKRSPPHGFDEWYKFAVDNGVKLIDEYDGIERDLAPFRGWSKAALEQRVLDAIEAHGITKPGDPHLLLQFNVSGKGGIMTQAAHHDEVVTDNPVSKLIDPIAEHLKESGISSSLLVNSYDEPRGLTRPGRKSNEKIRVDDFSVKPTWTQIRQACTRSKRRKQVSINREGIYDICAARKAPTPHHGLFTSPSSFNPFNDVVPILSNAKTSHMDDLLGPAPAYFKDYFRHYDKIDNTPFSSKAKQIYWRGGSTGMDLNRGYWLDGHRHRFVFYAKTISDRILWKTSEHRSSVLSSEQNRPLIDAAFAGVFRCSRENCDGIIQHTPPLQTVEPEEQFKYQIVADIDGEGMSGRYYFLLSSNSAVMKQSIFREWHSEWLIPWVHYIPLSLQMDELEILAHWLLETKEGQRQAKKIAIASTKVVKECLRDIDATVYLYRLFMEYASIGA